MTEVVKPPTCFRCGKLVECVRAMRDPWVGVLHFEIVHVDNSSCHAELGFADWSHRGENDNSTDALIEKLEALGVPLLVSK